MPPSVQNVVYVRGSAGDVTRALSRLAYVASGSPGGAGGLVRVLQNRIGLALLGRVREAFVTKSRGGTDEAGDKWTALSPHTVAYTRRHPGVPKRRPFWTYHPSFSVTEKRRDEWWGFYYSGRQRGWTKRHAAAVAWVILRKKYPGIKTLMDKFGNAPVEILRDSGVLLNSLSPGVDPDSAPPTVPKNQNQIFRNLPGEVIIGTNRKGAAANHRGVPGRLPKRRLWPEPAKWPATWLHGLLTQMQAGVTEIALYLIRGSR